jgi:DNA-binding transcriptional LysR family regulator
MVRPLPPLNALRAFEAAGRHQSFSKAGEELGVSHSSISRHVRGLEDRLGVQLFRDLPRGLALSPDGAAYLARIVPAFDVIAEATEALTETPEGSVSVNGEPLFTLQWLVPRLSEFAALRPDVQIELDASSALTDVARHEADLAIRFVPEGGGYADAEVLTDAPVHPYAAPGLVPGVLADPADVVKLPLIRRRTDRLWPKWCAAAGVPVPETPASVLRMSMALELASAVAGQGVVLLSAELADPDVSAGRLIRISDVGFQDGAFQLIRTEGALRRKSVRVFRDWLMERASPWRSGAR